MEPLVNKAVITQEDGAYVALCPEYDVASQGDTPEEARANLVEALTLFPRLRTSMAYYFASCTRISVP